LAAPAPDADLDVNPRKQSRKKANEDAHEEAVAQLDKKVNKKRISTEQTKTDSPPEETGEVL